MSNVHLNSQLDKQDEEIEAVRRSCIEEYGIRVLTHNETIGGEMCPPSFDTIACWPPTLAGTVAIKDCPSYVLGFITGKNATRDCMEDGTWYVDKTINQYWTNYNRCIEHPIVTIYREHNKTNLLPGLEEFGPIIRLVSNTGYFISFSSLIIAFGIMLFIKKLHCSRNILHMHLFASFIFRASFSLAKSLFFVGGTGLPGDMHTKNGSIYFHITPYSNNWGCKVIVSLEQYFIVANYSWVLMEGLYLHNLIFRALFVESTNSIKWYVTLGWGLPLLVTASWVRMRLLLEDTYCWTIIDNLPVFLIICIPLETSVVINSFLFIRISKVLYKKLRSPLNEESKKYKKWFKSTLILVPLFGFHYAIILALYPFIKTNSVVHLLWLTGDLFFGSFQGFLVAILYCFLNGEVKSEIQPHFYYLMTFLATNKFSRYFFPCRKKFLRSVVGRCSVSTTMSCSSLYTNGILHRSSKCRLDSIPKTKGDKVKDLHICNNGTSRKNSKTYRHSQPYNFLAETTLCVEINTSKCRSEPQIHEESLKMIHNNF